jgi:hypothetical protein
MKPNAALAFVLAGTSLAILTYAPTGSLVAAGRACAAAVALVGLLTLSQYLSGRDFGIDQLLFRDATGAVGTSHPGRMAPTTTLDFVMLGLALLLLDQQTASGRRPAEYLALAAALVALLAVVGYLYGVEAFYALTVYTQMAVHTAAAFVVLSAGVLCARPDRGWMEVLTSDSAGGLLMRRLLPAGLLVPQGLGGLRLAGQRAGLYLTEYGVSSLVVASVVGRCRPSSVRPGGWAGSSTS